MLEEYLACLHHRIRYYVKLDNPSSFEQAVNKAQAVEQLAEAAVDRLINPTLFVCLIAAQYLTGGYSQPGLVFPTDGDDCFWRMPLSFKCSKLVPGASTQLRADDPALSSQHQRYDSPASLCEFVEQTVF
ncbi:unnamed protein product [Heligmosomoides polygyrus]|uniref:FERM domain-containing protein n=1 Tax=Heligmosomoides polygyrus TaxID=6339 RepID=A0A183G178_HELPZ|nr:unnamed protein product [Heligmosomoides polygyrus]